MWSQVLARRALTPAVAITGALLACAATGCGGSRPGAREPTSASASSHIGKDRAAADRVSPAQVTAPGTADATPAAAAAEPAPGPAPRSPARLSIDDVLLRAVVDLPLEDVELIVRTELAQQNINVVGMLDLQQALANRDVSFPKYRVLQFCNLQDGLVFFRDHPDYGAFVPCSLLMYEKDNRTHLASRRPLAIVHGLPGHRPSEEAVAVAGRIEAQVKAVLQAVVEEARAQSKSP